MLRISSWAVRKMLKIYYVINHELTIFVQTEIKSNKNGRNIRNWVLAQGFAVRK